MAELLHESRGDEDTPTQSTCCLVTGPMLAVPTARVTERTLMLRKVTFSPPGLGLLPARAAGQLKAPPVLKLYSLPST